MAKTRISDGNNLVFVSAVVIWEIRIKQSLGKLKMPPEFRRILDLQPFDFLPINLDHAHAVGELPLIHRDPFDRMLIAQAKIERFTIITRDSLFKKYNVPIIKA